MVKWSTNDLPRRLNLGCGFDHRAGYLNVDFQDFHHPDLVADVRNLAELPSAYFDEILAQDVLEHLERQDIDTVLQEWGRLLRTGGALVLRVPDIIGVARLLSQRTDLDSQRVLIQNLFGTQAYSGDYHHAGFTEVTLRASLAAAGFEVESMTPKDEWLFDVIARRASGPVAYDPAHLTFMGRVQDDPIPTPPQTQEPSVARPSPLVAVTGMPRLAARRVCSRVLDALAIRIAQRLAEQLRPVEARSPAETPIHGTTAQSMTIRLDYPVDPRPRYGWDGRPRHPEIDKMLRQEHTRIAARVEEIVSVGDRLADIPAHADDDDRTPRWNNAWLPGLDGASLYAFVAVRRPATYLEVGSGNSTKFVRRAVTDFGLSTRIISVDPTPRAEVDAICDEVIREPLECIDLGLFEKLQSGDVVFVDNSHCAYTNSDVTVAFLDVLPRLPADVLLGIHDIYLPFDYPPDWSNRFYNEQYLLAAFLLGGHRGFKVEFPAYWVSQDRDLSARFESLWANPSMRTTERHGGAFWLSSDGPV